MKQRSANTIFSSLFLVISAGTAVAEGDKSAPTVSVRMTREDIAESAKAPEFTKPRDLSHVLYEKISLLATTLTARQGGSNRALADIAAKTQQIEYSTLLKRESVLHYEPTESAKTDSDRIRVHLLGQTRKSGEVKFKQAFPLIERVQKGLSFKVSKDTKLIDKQVAAAPEIRYGLVIQDIVAEDTVSVAALGSITDTYGEFSRPAKIIYTIDRVEADTSSNRVFPNYAPEASTPVAPAAPAPAPSIWSRFRAPSTDVGVTIEAANSEESVSDKVGTGALPGGKVTLTQADGLFSTQIMTNSRLAKESVSYNAKLPLIGEAHITRSYNESFHPIVTSANNLLVTPAAPKLHIHRLETEKRFKGELFVKQGLFDMGIAVEPRVGWAPSSKVGKVGDRVSLTISNQF